MTIVLMQKNFSLKDRKLKRFNEWCFLLIIHSSKNFLAIYQLSCQSLKG